MDSNANVLQDISGTPTLIVVWFKDAEVILNVIQTTHVSMVNVVHLVSVDPMLYVMFPITNRNANALLGIAETQPYPAHLHRTLVNQIHAELVLFVNWIKEIQFATVPRV